jgi:hypothetical protein
VRAVINDLRTRESVGNGWVDSNKLRRFSRSSLAFSESSATTALLVALSFFEEGESGDASSSTLAWAAVNFGDTVGVFTDKLALGLGAVGFVAFPIAFRLFADSLALGLGSLIISKLSYLAVSYAVRSFANCDTFRAIEQFTSLIWAFNL